MTEKKVGRFVITVELDRVEGPMKYYDAVVSEDGSEVKICKGCVGEKSGIYWGKYLEKWARKLNIMLDRLQMVEHNANCYFGKPEYEVQYMEACEERDFLLEWIEDHKK